MLAIQPGENISFLNIPSQVRKSIINRIKFMEYSLHVFPFKFPQFPNVKLRAFDHNFYVSFTHQRLHVPLLADVFCLPSHNFMNSNRLPVTILWTAVVFPVTFQTMWLQSSEVEI